MPTDREPPMTAARAIDIRFYEVKESITDYSSLRWQFNLRVKVRSKIMSYLEDRDPGSIK
jgi:hypothetical protein